MWDWLKNTMASTDSFYDMEGKPFLVKISMILLWSCYFVSPFLVWLGFLMKVIIWAGLEFYILYEAKEFLLSFSLYGDVDPLFRALRENLYLPHEINAFWHYVSFILFYPTALYLLIFCFLGTITATIIPPFLVYQLIKYFFEKE
ncbi:hypothetical protein N9L87_02135 [Rhodobacteraceae bacterium]|nr:hypothetical protein [Paracoccaceae bacterium]